MSTKTILAYGAVVVVLVVIALYALIAFEKKDTQNAEDEPLVTPETTAVEQTGVVTAINLDGIAADGPALVTFVSDDGSRYTIALPSMGRLLCAAQETIASAESAEVGDQIEVRGEQEDGGNIVPCEDVTHYFRVTGIVQDEETALNFSYRKGPNGYMLRVDPHQMSTIPDFVRGYQLMLVNDYLEMQNVTVPREGPPTIEIRAYKNTDALEPAMWAENNPLESNVKLAVENPVEATVAGAKAVQYRTNGLYVADTYVVTQGDFVYVFIASFVDESSPMSADLKTLLDTIAFIPPEPEL
jgi:hypothetical protein